MSSKKLHDILNPSSAYIKNQEKSINVNQHVPLPRLSHMRPTSSTPRNEYSNTPSIYMTLPKNQNIFYNPVSTNYREAISPSPKFQLSLNFRTKLYLPSSLMNSDAEMEIFEENRLNNKNKYNQASDDFHSNCQQLLSGSTKQPKNLKELLQRSFSTVPSNSPFHASFHSVMPSPFLSHSTPKSQLCRSTAFKTNNQCSSGILGTPSQSLGILQEKNLNSCQSTKTESQNTLIGQIEKISGKENDRATEIIVNQLLSKFQTFGVLSDDILNNEVAIINNLRQNKSPNKVLPQQRCFNKNMLEPLNSPKQLDLQYVKSDNYQQKLFGSLTESQVQHLNNGMIQESDFDLKDQTFEKDKDNYIVTDSLKIKNWTKKLLSKRNTKRRAKLLGKRPRVKGKFITLEEYQEYRKSKADEDNDISLNWEKPL